MCGHHAQGLMRPSLTKHRAILDWNKLEVHELSNRPDLKDEHGVRFGGAVILVCWIRCCC